MKKILVIGNGAREHAICEALRRSRHEVELYVVGGANNPGILELASEYMLADVMDNEAICEFAKEQAVDFAVVGPEAPIANAVVDKLAEIAVPSASPLQTVGRLESSKAFTRGLLAKYGIEGNPKYRAFTSDEGLEEFFEELGDEFVVKADDLQGGKGVKLSGEHLDGVREGLEYAKECLKESGRVVIEEKLVGQEFSLMCFSDGESVKVMPAAQDHKRAYENDEGPNTGGMGSYSMSDHSLPFLEKSDIDTAVRITEEVAEALEKETGKKFKGVMYGGWIAVKNGVRLIEYNARFGDPEAMNVLPIMKTDFVDLCEAIIEGRLKEFELEFEKRATVCKYVVPEGYPEKPVKGEKIEIGDLPGGARIYYASVDQREGGLYLGGSRAIACVGVADSLEEAEKIAQQAAEAVNGPVFFRKDVGTRELVQKRIDHMKELRA